MTKQIGDKITQGRKDKQMTQEEFAARLGVTPQAVSRWERGQGLPDIALVGGICTILGMNANELLCIDTVSKIIENEDEAMRREIQSLMIAEPLMIVFGKGLISAFEQGLETNYVNQKRKELVSRSGILMPTMRIRDCMELEDWEYRILSYDRLLKKGVWDQTQESPFQTLIDEMAQECAEHYDLILNKQIVRNIVENVKTMFPGIADNVIPEKISYLQLMEVLKGIFRKKGNLHNIIRIIELTESEMVVNQNMEIKSVVEHVFIAMEDEKKSC